MSPLSRGLSLWRPRNLPLIIIPLLLLVSYYYTPFQYDIWDADPVSPLSTQDVSSMHIKSQAAAHTAQGHAPPPPPPPPPKHDPPQSPWCVGAECTAGRWVPNTERLRTLKDVHRVYPNKWMPTWPGCPIAGDADGNPIEDEAEKERLEGERLARLLNYHWEPSRGKLIDYDPVAFVVRLLKSPGGLIMVGDSLSRQFFHSMYYTFRQYDIVFESNPGHLKLAGTPHTEQFVLRPSHPFTKELQKMAGVPDSRMSRPFFTLLEDHMTLGESDIRAITEAPSTYKWINNFRRVEGWEDHIKYMATPVEGEEEGVNADTIVMLNAGAHWSRHELPMIDHSKDLGDQRLVERAYSRMIDLNAARLSPIARTKIFYRTTSPGHPSCLTQNEPYTSLEAAHEGERHLVDRLVALADDPRVTPPEMRAEMLTQRVRWDWDLFVPHNELWRKRIGELQQQRAAQQRAADAQEELDKREGEQERQMHRQKQQHAGKPKAEGTHWVEAEEVNAQWYYFDVWDMSLQRPDAHLKPGKDCLHFCLPSVFNEWIHLFNHDLHLIENGKPTTA